MSGMARKTAVAMRRAHAVAARAADAWAMHVGEEREGRGYMSVYDYEYDRSFARHMTRLQQRETA